jgi:hypothetical protein
LVRTTTLHRARKKTSPNRPPRSGARESKHKGGLTDDLRPVGPETDQQQPAYIIGFEQSGTGDRVASFANTQVRRNGVTTGRRVPSEGAGSGVRVCECPQDVVAALRHLRSVPRGAGRTTA